MDDGGQIVPPQDKEIIAEIDALSFEDINFNANTDLIEAIDKEVDEAFFEASVANGSFNADGKDNFHMYLRQSTVPLLPLFLRF